MKCRYVNAEQPRIIVGRHGPECPARLAETGPGDAHGVDAATPGATDDERGPEIGPECIGCEPCMERHCLVQWYGDRGDCETHAESVCPSCVGKVREHMSEVVRLSGLPLLEQVLSAGDTDTEAADLLGPAANPHQWRQRGDHGHIYDPESRLGGLHPLWVLGKYDLLVTEHLGHKRRTTRITITRAASYLDRNLTWLAADLEFDFLDMATELAECRTHLERVLHDGEQVETGAPCMDCRVLLRRKRAALQAADGWYCPRCRQESSEDQYRLAVRNLARETAEWLTDREMEIRTGVKATTVRSWGRDDGPVRRRRDSERTVYAVADVERVAREKGMMSA